MISGEVSHAVAEDDFTASEDGIITEVISLH
jgi:hypothetical protein